MDILPITLSHAIVQPGSPASSSGSVLAFSIPRLRFPVLHPVGPIHNTPRRCVSALQSYADRSCSSIVNEGRRAMITYQDLMQRSLTQKLGKLQVAACLKMLDYMLFFLLQE